MQLPLSQHVILNVGAVETELLGELNPDDCFEMLSVSLDAQDPLNILQQNDDERANPGLPT